MNSILVALVPIACIALWTAAVLIDAGFAPAVNRWLKEPGNDIRFATVLIASIFVFITLPNPIDTLFGSLRTEAISIAFAVVVLNELGNRRAALQEKRRIIGQMGSPVNDAALEAVRLARKYGWLKDGSLKDVNLREANLQGANLEGANLKGANLSGASLEGIRLWYADLKGSDLWCAHLEHANLGYANLEGANLWGSYLEGAIFWDANLKEVRLRQATYDSKTIWPLGFDFVAAGAVLADLQFRRF